jgi:tetratricopeptide (TPR) repeat protein
MLVKRHRFGIDMRVIILILLATTAFGQSNLRRAGELYDQTEYQASLSLLRESAPATPEKYCLEGRNYFMLGDFKKATDAFEKAFDADSSNSVYAHWLGRSYGRRAETSNMLAAPHYASKARFYFEKAVALNPNNGEALNDLFDYYLEAPGFLGGGFDKAEQVAKRIAQHDEAEGHFAQAQLADRRKQFDTAEEQLRRAMELAPRQVGRVIDLAKYLAKHGRIQESEAAFDRAERLDPNNPGVKFARARVYIEQKRNLDKARVLLRSYLESKLTPDDPSREQAQKLLRQIMGA